MFKKINRKNKKGFTLAELLIVVAIIGVLVAISIPIFTSQLDKAKLATATANVRSVVAEYSADCLSSNPPKSPSIAEAVSKAQSMDAKQKQDCTIAAATNGISVKNGAGENIVPVGLTTTSG